MLIIYFPYFFQHIDTAQKLLHPGERPPMDGLSSASDKKRDLKRQSNHHIHIDMTEFSYPWNNDDLEVYFSLYSTKENSYVSERVIVQPQDMAVSSDPSGAIFMDAGNLDQIRDLHLVCHVIRLGKMVSNNNDGFNTLTTKKPMNFRRPFACGVMNISKIITKG
jgi:hypothetical protein